MWNFIEFILHKIIFDLFHLSISEDKWKGFLQFVKFGIVGLSNTVISYVIYVVALLGFQKGGIFPKQII